MLSHDPVAVITRQDGSVDGPNAVTLKDGYLVDQNPLDDGSENVRLDLNSEGSTKTAFYDHIGQSVSDVKKVWLRKKLSGEAQPPEKVSSDQMIDKVSSTSAAIGYVPADAVTDAVKVIATIE